MLFLGSSLLIQSTTRTTLIHTTTYTPETSLLLTFFL